MICLKCKDTRELITDCHKVGSLRDQFFFFFNVFNYITQRLEESFAGNFNPQSL